MLFPSIFRENLYDDFFGNPFGFGRMPAAPAAHAMKTDVKETADGFELIMDLPGFKKEDISAELKDGYLTVRAESSQSSEQNADDGSYIRRERYTGSFSRSFYVGEEVTEADIKAKFADGVLTLDVPKKEPAPKIPEKKIIAIE